MLAHLVGSVKKERLCGPVFHIPELNGQWEGLLGQDCCVKRICRRHNSLQPEPNLWTYESYIDFMLSGANADNVKFSVVCRPST